MRVSLNRAFQTILGAGLEVRDLYVGFTGFSSTILEYFVLDLFLKGTNTN